ncbi:hypothetical protein A11S_2391 [Micavibrio aeruginosavorus EPB]|uniref:Uncharacterized protein n=1 Tax=Micavibrio aeruginosavorus EPB TaxID=349215 RepID=M4VKZ3_9BACT|nr:hypothetical protein A11S_2391 [Micavibrio aeruginosavorus EPB]
MAGRISAFPGCCGFATFRMLFLKITLLDKGFKKCAQV